MTGRRVDRERRLILTFGQLTTVLGVPLPPVQSKFPVILISRCLNLNVAKDETWLVLVLGFARSDDNPTRASTSQLCMYEYATDSYESESESAILAYAQTFTFAFTILVPVCHPVGYNGPTRKGVGQAAWRSKSMCVLYACMYIL
jgi:hypothetical protein